MFSRSLYSLSISDANLSALKRAGFETVEDLGTLTAEQLSDELKIPSFLCEEILRATRNTTDLLTQPATTLLQSTQSSFSVSEPINALLGVGGLKKGHILELSGPPGSPKQLAVLDLIKNVAVAEEEAIFLDTQNMTLPSTLKNATKDIPGSQERIHYIRCQSLPELIAFMYNIPTLLDDHPKTSLLVLNTISFLFHALLINNATRASILEQIKAILAKVCATRHIAVVVTVQLATKMVGADGSTANFDTAKKVVMAPQLGDSYLPSGRSHRLIFLPDSPTTGMVRLLASPSRTAKQLQTEIVQEPYELINGSLQRKL